MQNLSFYTVLSSFLTKQEPILATWCAKACRNRRKREGVWDGRTDSLCSFKKYCSGVGNLAKDAALMIQGYRNKILIFRFENCKKNFQEGESGTNLFACLG